MVNETASRGGAGYWRISLRAGYPAPALGVLGERTIPTQRRKDRQGYAVVPYGNEMSNIELRMSNDERPAQPAPRLGLIRNSSFMIRYSIFARGFVLFGSGYAGLGGERDEGRGASVQESNRKPASTSTLPAIARGLQVRLLALTQIGRQPIYTDKFISQRRKDRQGVTPLPIQGFFGLG